MELFLSSEQTGAFRCSRTGSRTVFVRCSYGVRTVSVRCSRVVRALSVRCSCVVRTVFVRCSYVVRAVFVRCSLVVFAPARKRYSGFGPISVCTCCHNNYNVGANPIYGNGPYRGCSAAHTTQELSGSRHTRKIVKHKRTERGWSAGWCLV